MAVAPRRAVDQVREAAIVARSKRALSDLSWNELNSRATRARGDDEGAALMANKALAPYLDEMGRRHGEARRKAGWLNSGQYDRTGMEAAGR